jgi:hypothetical protein
MGLLDKLLAAPFKGIIEAVGGLIDGISTTDEEKLEAKARLLTITLEAEKVFAAADAQFAEMQSRVIIAEAQSESWWARNWRPFTMLSFVLVIFYNAMAGPLLGTATVPIPGDMWDVIKLGLTGYIAGRTIEKSVDKWKNGKGRELT